MKIPMLFGLSAAIGATFKTVFSPAGTPAGVAKAYGVDSARPPPQADSHHRDRKRKNVFDYNFRPFILGEVLNLAEDVAVFRFLLNDPEDEFNLVPCSTLQACFKAGAQIVEQPMRFYTPITPNGEKGYFDLLVKKQPGGRMTEHLFSMETGESLLFRVIQYKMTYKPNKWKRVGLIGGGTGITPLLQVIQAALGDQKDTTKLSLLFANRSEDKILLRGLLDKLEKESQGRFDIKYVVDSTKNPSWTGFVGHINAAMIKATMPPPSDENLLLVCGPDPMMGNLVGASIGMLRAMSGGNPMQPGGANLNNFVDLGGVMAGMGYTREQVYRF